MSTDIEYNNVNTQSNRSDDIFFEGSGGKLSKSKPLVIISNSSKIATPRGSNQRISLNDMPPEIANKLRHLDLGNDGYLDIEDILVLDEKEQLEKKTMAQYKKLIIALFIIWVLQIAAVFAVSFAAISASKDSYVTNNTLQTKSGATVQVASVDYCTSSTGTMILRSGGSCPSDETVKPPAIATASSTVQIPLSSDLSTSTLAELKSLHLVSPTDVEVLITVYGYIRKSSDNLIIITNIGDLTLRGTSLFVNDTTSQKYFQIAGFNIVTTRTSRRLELNDNSVNGTFNNVGTLTPSQCPLTRGPVTVVGTTLGTTYNMCRTVTSVTIASTLTTIANYAFQGCTALIQVSLTDGLRILSYGMFQSSGVVTVTIPSTIISVGDFAFVYCAALTLISLTNGLSIVGKSMFREAGVVTVTIPSTVTSVGLKAFAEIPSLKCVYWIGNIITTPTDIFLGSPNAQACTFTPTISPSNSPTVIPSDIPSIIPSALPCPATPGPVTVVGTTLAAETFNRCLTVTSVTVASTLTLIGSFAFQACTALSRVSLTNGLTILSYGMFQSSGVVTVTIPSTVTSVGDFAFAFCAALTLIFLTNGLSIVTNSMFLGAGVVRVTIPSTVTSVGSQAFASISSLKCVFWNGNIITTPTDIFLDSPNAQVCAQCSLTRGPVAVVGTTLATETYNMCRTVTSVTVASTLTRIGNYAFQGCTALSQVSLTDGLRILSYGMFQSSGVVTVTIPSTIKSVGDFAFVYCAALTLISLTNGLSIVGKSMFREAKVVTVTIPSTVTSVGSKAFAEIRSLKCVYWIGNVITTPTDIFLGSPNAQACTTINLQCPATPGPATVVGTTLAAETFNRCLTVTSVTVASTLTEIASFAFQACTSLSQVSLTDGLTILSYGMFQTSGVVTVTIPSTVTSVGDFAFVWCGSLTLISLTNGLSIMGYSMFREAGVVTVTIPSTVTSVGSEAFAYISSLTCVVWIGNVITTPTDIFLFSPDAQACNIQTSQDPLASPSQDPLALPSQEPSITNKPALALFTLLPTTPCNQLRATCSSNSDCCSGNCNSSGSCDVATPSPSYEATILPSQGPFTDKPSVACKASGVACTGSVECCSSSCIIVGKAGSCN